MKNNKGYLVLLLMMILAAACFGLLKEVTRYGKDEKEAGKRNYGVMEVICPKLSESADAFLILEGKHAILIDTGVTQDTETLLAMLEQYEVNHLDALILTHYDKDHIGGAAGVLKALTVEKCYMTCGSEDSAEYRAFMDALVENGAEQILPTTTLTVQNQDSSYTIYPPLSYTYEKNNDNNRSLIVTFSYEGKHLLFAGDAQGLRMNEYLKQQYDGSSFDFVKIPHHGRNKKPVELLLKKGIPSLALITSSEEEPADEDLVEQLNQAGITVAYPKDGNVIVQVDQEGIRFLP